MSIDRIKKLCETKCSLSNGVEFTVVHDFERMEGPINSFEAAYESWLFRVDDPEDYNVDHFVDYVKRKDPERIFVSLETYLKVTKGRTVKATKEEFEAENN